MFQSIRYVFRKELIHTFRDPRMRFMMFVAPILQLVAFGYAATFDVKNISLYVVDYDRTSSSREVSSSFTSSPYFRETKFSSCDSLQDSSCATKAMDQGLAMAVLSIPKGFTKDLERGEEANVQLLVDGTNSNSATIIQNYSEIIISSLNRTYIQKRNQKMSFNISAGKSTANNLRASTILPALRVWYNEELEAKFFMVPAVFAMVLFILTIILTAMALTRERELGTYEQLIVSPIKPMDLIIGKSVPFAFIGLVQVTLILIASWFIFGVTVKGSLLLFYFSSLIFLLTSLGFGIFISSICQTMQQAMMMTFMMLFPMMILSGMMFPIENMPQLFQWISLADPLRYFIEVVRAIVLKGAGIDFVGPRLIVLFIFGIGSLFFAARGFRKTLN